MVQLYDVLLCSATMHILMTAVMALFARHKVEYLSLAWILGIFGFSIIFILPFANDIQITHLGIMHPMMPNSRNKPAIINNAISIIYWFISSIAFSIISSLSVLTMFTVTSGAMPSSMSFLSASYIRTLEKRTVHPHGIS